MVGISAKACAMPSPVRPKMMFLVTEDWYFWAHRLPQARAARDAGFAVAVATRVTGHGALIVGEGFALHPLGWRRGSASPLDGLRAIAEITSLYRRERPEIVHHVSQKPILIGSLAALLSGRRRIVNAFTGLGFIFASADGQTRLIRLGILTVLRLAATHPGMRILVENPDDGARLRRLKVAPADRIILIRGSGVDLARYELLPEPAAPPVVIGCATRMLRIKGVAELVAAYRRLRERGSSAVLLLAGAADPENPASIPADQLRAWATEPGVEWAGHVDDVRNVWRRAHIAVLASQGGEGIPMSLMEAAACGRPMIATDVPGCREIVVPGETGLLVAPGNIDALADALDRMIGDAELRKKCGEAARLRVAQGLDAVTVGRQTVEVYRALMAAAA
jgi:glycosyltransferase involved in cell wall biosynthesis